MPDNSGKSCLQKADMIIINRQSCPEYASLPLENRTSATQIKISTNILLTSRRNLSPRDDTDSALGTMDSELSRPSRTLSTNYRFKIFSESNIFKACKAMVLFWIMLYATPRSSYWFSDSKIFHRTSFCCWSINDSKVDSASSTVSHLFTSCASLSPRVTQPAGWGCGPGGVEVAVIF